MIQAIKENIELLAVFVSFLPIVISLVSLFLKKGREQEIKNYQRVHSLIKNLSNQNGTVGLDQQLAIIFEMKNLPQYRPVIKRILENSIIRWKKQEDLKYKQLIEESEYTLRYLDTISLYRLYLKIKSYLWRTEDAKDKKY